MSDLFIPENTDHIIIRVPVGIPGEFLFRYKTYRINRSK